MSHERLREILAWPCDLAGEGCRLTVSRTWVPLRRNCAESQVTLPSAPFTDEDNKAGDGDVTHSQSQVEHPGPKAGLTTELVLTIVWAASL